MLGCLFVASTLNMPALAHENDTVENSAAPQPLSDANIKIFHYDFNASSATSPKYETLRKIMSPVFKGTYADEGAKFYSNPLIASAEFDLNNDKAYDIVARPVDTEDDGDVFCGPKLLCPNYVIDMRGKEPQVIGVIPAMKVDRGDEVKNGHWTLKAFNRQTDPADFSKYDTYSYDKKTGRYQLDKAIPPQTLTTK